MAARSTVAVFLSLALVLGDDCLEDQNVQMLQLDTSIDEKKHHSEKSRSRKTHRKSLQNCGHLIGNECDPSANFDCSNNCAVHTHGQDCYRPVPQVMADHPGEDGYCYFNYTGFWVTPVGDDPDFEEYAVRGILGLRNAAFSNYRGFKTGPVLTYHFEGKVITTQMDASHYSFDDLYGYSLGYLQGQGLEAWMIQDSQGWISIVEQRCKEIQHTYNFQDDELLLADWLDDNQVLATQVGCAANMSVVGQRSDVLEKAKYHSSQNCQPITARDFAKHHYIKCFLGYPNAASDAAYLLARACLIGNHIGHFTDCPYSPNISF